MVAVVAAVPPARQVRAVAVAELTQKQLMSLLQEGQALNTTSVLPVQQEGMVALVALAATLGLTVPALAPHRAEQKLELLVPRLLPEALEVRQPPLLVVLVVEP